MTSLNHKIAIIDYGVGNLFSVKHACEAFGMEGVITSSVQIIQNSDAVILPGVGAFGSAMQSLEDNGLVPVIKDAAFSGKPFLGICLGMQLLFEKSHEFGLFDGLGIVKGEVVRFSQPYGSSEKHFKVPHVGWNKINPAQEKTWENSYFKTLSKGTYMYFVHSYFAVPTDPEIILSNTRYGDQTFCSSFQYKNILGCQFHPEKSGPEGLEIYKALASELNFR
ncbi:MAG: imidazole glycerol phosphate synthase subunit HisH [Pseudomonadota bacterium]